jgi:predicted aconitase with swiveling domain
MGTVNPKTGVIIERKHELEGQCLQGKILVFPYSKGSTGGSYMLYDVVKNGVGPAGIINVEAESVVTIGAIIAELPMVDQVDITQIQNGDYVYLNATEGKIRIVRG